MDHMRAALSHRDFRLLFIGQATSVLGDMLTFVVVGLLVLDLTGSVTDTGLVLAAYTVPLVLFLLVGGVIADRLPRKALMIATDIGRAALHATLAVLIATDVVAIWHMVVIGVLFGTAEAFFRPAYSGLLPQTVAEEHIQPAQALTGATRELASFAGPALGTFIYFWSGAATAFAIDAATFVVSAIALAGIRPRTRGDAPAAAASMLVELREGWTAVRSRAWVWATILAFSFSLLVALAPFFVLGAKVGDDVYASPAVYGAVVAVWGVGSMLGSLVGVRWRPQHPMRLGMLVAAPWTLALTVYALGAPLALVYVAMASSGAGLGLFTVYWETALAERIPPHLLSRVSAYDWMGSLALLPLGYLLAGPVGEAVGEAQALAVGGALGAIAMVLGCLPRSTWTLERVEHAPVHQRRYAWEPEQGCSVP